MKNIYNIISAIILCFIVGTGCETMSPEDILNNNVVGGKGINILLCSNWGMTKDQVKAEMKGYTLYEETDDNLYFSANNTSHIISYEFFDGELCTALVMAIEDVVSDSSILKFVSGYTEVGYVDNKMVYLNENNNTVATYGTEVDQKVHYKALGLTQSDFNIPGNLIYYKTTNNKKLTPWVSKPFNVKILSNTYNGGIGIIECEGDITHINSKSFYCCEYLESITIPDSVTSIGEEAFARTGLTSVTIPDSVTSIGNSAFYRCCSLTVFYGKFVSADNRCFIIDGVVNSFAPAGLTEYTIPDSVTKIGNRAFCCCDSLTSITIPDSVTSIGDYAFSGCTSLTSITIPDSVTSIGDYAFASCTSLASITIPDSVTSIGGSTFFNCKLLKSITIPDSVTKIGGYVFRDCSSLKSVDCKPSTPPTGGERMFTYYSNASYHPIGCKIYVPIGSGTAYKTAQYWSDYKSYIKEKEF